MLDYLIDKRTPEISLSEIFADTGLNKLNWDFQTSADLGYTDSEGMEHDLHEMVPDKDMQEMAQNCENLRKELCD